MSFVPFRCGECGGIVQMLDAGGLAFRITADRDVEIPRGTLAPMCAACREIWWGPGDMTRVVEACVAKLLTDSDAMRKRIRDQRGELHKLLHFVRERQLELDERRTYARLLREHLLNALGALEEIDKAVDLPDVVRAGVRVILSICADPAPPAWLGTIP